ncbi:MAG TPA: DUF3426 domain-containing protein [Rhizomicrobium sp.]|nr:DUF3426 domain-containing protein [Rhizomicrobium sp.]
MILTCPSCGTRYSVDGAKFPSQGRTVRCAKCGHSWHQAAEAEPEPEAVRDTPPPTPSPDAMSGAVPGSAPDPVPDPVAAISTRAYAPPAAAEQPRAALGPKLAVVAGWIGLIAVVLLIGASAVRYRQDIAVIWPQSAGVYSTLGLKVNASGIDFQSVSYKRDTEDNQTVLSVSGTIVNTGSRELPVPQTVRVTLSDAGNRELYHWTFKPNATVLKAGQSVPFTTRLSSPPAAAAHLEVRFAKDGA